MNLHYEAREIVNAMQDFMYRTAIARDLVGDEYITDKEVAKERLIEMIEIALEKAAEQK